MTEIKSTEEIIRRINKLRIIRGLPEIKEGIEKKSSDIELNNIKTIKEDYPFSLEGSKLTYWKKANGI